MEQDELRWLRILDFQSQLKHKLNTTEPADWPSALWVYEQLTRAMFGEINKNESHIGENQLD